MRGDWKLLSQDLRPCIQTRAISSTTASRIGCERLSSQVRSLSAANTNNPSQVTRAGEYEWVLIIRTNSETPAEFRRGAFSATQNRTATIGRRMVSLSAGESSVASVTLIVRMVNERLREARWDSLSHELQEVASNLNSVRPEMVIATLRSAYRWRDRLHGWSVLLDAAREDFLKRGLPADRLLRGLA